MLWILYLLVLIVLVQPRTDTWNEVFNSNGWTPVTRERVFSGIEREVIGQEIGENVHNRHKNNVHIIDNGVHNKENLQRVSEQRYVVRVTDRNERQSSNDEDRTESNGKYENIVSSNSGYRRPKVISRNYSINAINSLAASTINELTEKFDNVPKEELIKDAGVNRYEVTESSKELLRQQGNFNIYTNTSDLLDEVHEAEIVDPDSANDFTSKLLSILSSYNIRVNDVLPNYQLSRNFKRNFPKQEFFFLPIPIRYSSKYNNLNSFADDPILVVFLSNHGDLPGRYGLRNRFHNLYGHLSSNNRLGSYKIYSDTDSSQ